LRDISLHPVAPNMVELTWQYSYLSDEEVQKYKIIYTYGKETLSVSVTGSSRVNLTIEDGAMGIEAQVTLIEEQDTEDIEIFSSEPVFLELSDDGEFEFIVIYRLKILNCLFLVLGPNIPIYVTLSGKSTDRAVLSWLPPRNDDLKNKKYEVLYNFDNDNEFNIRQTEQTEEVIEIPEGNSILKAAVGVVPEQVEDPDAKQVPTVYSSFKYLDLRGRDSLPLMKRHDLIIHTNKSSYYFIMVPHV
uniref:Fibronectin type-III domain-containing protein n=1 Tax=Hymenolepis diminuta TaxID=6216 RepID=A0A0R3SXS6_HYMDI